MLVVVFELVSGSTRDFDAKGVTVAEEKKRKLAKSKTNKHRRVVDDAICVILRLLCDKTALNQNIFAKKKTAQ